MAMAAQLVGVILSPSHHLLETSKIRDQMKCFTKSLDCERVHLGFFFGFTNTSCAILNQKCLSFPLNKHCCCCASFALLHHVIVETKFRLRNPQNLLKQFFPFEVLKLRASMKTGIFLSHSPPDFSFKMLFRSQEFAQIIIF